MKLTATGLVVVDFESKDWSMTGQDGKPLAGTAHSIWLASNDPKVPNHRVKIKAEDSQELSPFTSIKAGDLVTLDCNFIKGDLIATALLEKKSPVGSQK